MAAAEKLTTKAAIEQVMSGKRKAMTVAEIAEAAIPLTALKGKTPKQTFYSVLYGEAKKADGLVVKAGDGGVFKLNAKRRKPTTKATAKATEFEAPTPPINRSPSSLRGPLGCDIYRGVSDTDTGNHMRLALALDGIADNAR